MTTPLALGKAGRAFDRARQFHASGDLELAFEAVIQAARAAPDHPAIAFLHAQIAYESWRPSVALFERAVALDRSNTSLVRNFILALGSEGQGARAEQLLEALLARNPAWLEGLDILATLRVTRGDADFARGYAVASKAEPYNSALWLAWFSRLATARDWAAADAVLARAEMQLPKRDTLRMARLYLASESGTASADPTQFDEFAGRHDAGFDLTRLRHALRHGQIDRAAGLAESHLGQAQESLFWPYAALAWRLLNDERFAWLEGEEPIHKVVDRSLDRSESGQLAEFLRGLHSMQAAYPEQSVRGGTQTDRNLLNHHDPLIRRLRARLLGAVSDWCDEMPEGEPIGPLHHPLYSRKPSPIRFAGSWSVLLSAQGFHSVHTHPVGWVSSALYVDLPSEMGVGKAGQLAIGGAPQELGLGLEARFHVEPLAGRLVLFPSTCWHGTEPFAEGERLTIAFDIAPGKHLSQSQGMA